MEKRRRNQLPEAMIQHIQSFLSAEEAAKTTVLSKSWYTAWLTRPNLVFDESHFKDYRRFSECSKKTLHRYRHLNLKIDSFEFWMRSSNVISYSLANELIVEAIKMGATDIAFDLSTTLKFVLPHDVLESETLVRLSIARCKIEGGNVRCWRLKYLHLRHVLLQEDLFWDIILSCPLIEDLELHECKCSGIKKLWNLCDGPVNQFELHKLKTLLLYKVKISSLFFSSFSSRFPCLKDLSVQNCSGYKKIQICSQSLELIRFEHGRMILKGDFDVPNIHKFCFSGEFLPSVSFPNSCNWDSDISISYGWRHRDLSAKWFLNLNKCLTNLSFSKVSLNLRTSYFSNIDKAGNTRCLPRPLVENLTINLECTKFALFDSLFQWCRPVYVTLYWRPKHSFKDGEEDLEFLEIFYKLLMQQDGVEEVTVGVFDKVVSGWQTVPWKSLLDASTSRVGKQSIRFHLRWG